MPETQIPGLSLFEDAIEYWVDASQRSILFWDVIRKRGNNYLEHLHKGQPPVLIFDYEVLIDGRTLERPVNYSLSRILPREGQTTDPTKRPVVVIDPRAGHGPGIGGTKEDSEIGLALKDSHPVYFIFFYTEPVPCQTLADVKNAEIFFLEEIRKRHPKAEEPSIIGNCQAGWATAMLGADRPDITGPLVLAGSPLSYWAGVDGSNPMRYRGGLCGGVWLSSFFSDLGKGTFDGANLVLNMELLNPANTFWTKQYNLYTKIDTEESRYLNFEKWWGGFFCMTSEEIHFIVDSLFVGNKLEQGAMKMEDDREIDLKNLKDPVVVFASQGDNITPPQQALNWIVKVYGSVEEIKRQQQVLVFMVHKKIGHLGIFVASSVAKKEHKEIIGTMDMIDYLEPGLYEMVIESGDNKMVMAENKVRFEARTFDDIMVLDDGMEDELDFEPVAFLSEYNDGIYQAFFSPAVKLATTEFTAEFLRQLHPLRLQRYPISDLNPMMIPVAAMANMVRKYRRPVSSDNVFVALEKHFSKGIEDCLNFYRDIRDLSEESVFKTLYGNPIVKQFFNKQLPEEMQTEINRQKEAQQVQSALEDEDVWLNRMTEGGFPEGVIRIMLAMANADHIIDKAEYIVSENIIRSHPVLQKMKPAKFKKMVKEQSRILQTDQELAIDTLVKLLKTPEERTEAFAIAEKIAMADEILADEEKTLLETIKKTLNITT
jgi:pimeloyl-ACP methyl ester carboxylesterase/tellurite resistance protein